MSSDWIETPIVDFVAPRTAVLPATQVRSTLLAASIQALRLRGHLERYTAALSGEWTDKLLNTPAGIWLPIEYGEVHYGACDALGLDDDGILAIGNSVAELTQKTVFSMATRLAKEAGASPVTVLAQSQRLWSRLFLGGAVGVFQTGPKDARFECLGIPLAQFHYFRVGYRGLMTAITAPFARTMLAREVKWSPTSLTLRFSWV